MLGGSHGRNGMVYLRGNDRDYNTWKERGNPSWNWKNALRFFKKSEQNRNEKLVAFENGKYHSADGKLIVDSFGGRPDPFMKMIIDAAEEYGHEFLDDLDSGKWLGYAFVMATIHNGRRQSVAKSFLIPAAKRKNLHIIKNALVSRIEIQSNETVGVHFTYNGEHQMFARNTKDVILSAGVINSPQILMLSGIGPREHLAALGIPVIKDLAVGKNLHDHVQVQLFFEFPLTPEHDPKEMLDKLYQLAVHNRGSLIEIDNFGLYAHLSSVNDTTYPDYQCSFVHLSRGPLTTAIVGSLHEPAQEALRQKVRERDIVMIKIALFNQKSRGKVELKSRSISDLPTIDFNFLDDNDDVETLLRAIKQQVSMAETKMYQEHGVKMIYLPMRGCPSFDDNADAYYRCYIHQFATTNTHLVGTSKMGPDTDPNAVVDHRLRVKGISKLRQIDAGIIPLVPSANVNIPVVMVGERGADFIKKDWNHNKVNAPRK